MRRFFYLTLKKVQIKRTQKLILKKPLNMILVIYLRFIFQFNCIMKRKMLIKQLKCKSFVSSSSIFSNMSFKANCIILFLFYFFSKALIMPSKKKVMKNFIECQAIVIMKKMNKTKLYIIIILHQSKYQKFTYWFNNYLY